jgi:hypothetical protein
MVNYFYKIENKINGNFYYGVHKTNNLEDGYMGSGKRIKYAIKKYGKENFKKEILFFFDTYQEALNFEAEIVNENLLLDTHCYNLMKGGLGGWEYINQNHSIKLKAGENISKTLKILYKEGIIKSKGWNYNQKGKILSQHTKDLISKNNANKLSSDEIQLRKEDFQNINKSRGWLTVLSKKWNVSHTQVKRFIKEFGE